MFKFSVFFMRSLILYLFFSIEVVETSQMVAITLFALIALLPASDCLLSFLHCLSACR